MEEIIELVNASKHLIWHDCKTNGSHDDTVTKSFKAIHWDIQVNCLDNVRLLIESYLLKQLPIVNIKLFNDIATNRIVRKYETTGNGSSNSRSMTQCIFTGRTDAQAIVPLCITTDPVAVYKQSGNHVTGESVAVLTAGISNISKLAKLGKRKTGSAHWELIGATSSIANLLLTYNELVRCVTNIEIYAAIELTCGTDQDLDDSDGKPQAKVFKGNTR